MSRYYDRKDSCLSANCNFRSHADARTSTQDKHVHCEVHLCVAHSRLTDEGGLSALMGQTSAWPEIRVVSRLVDTATPWCSRHLTICGLQRCLQRPRRH